MRLTRGDETYEVRGTKVTVPAEVEVCLACGEAISDETRDSEVMRRVYSAYRKQHGLLTPEEIRNIRRRYKLSQRSFAALLRMSEATINRYENGALQAGAHDTAIRACGSPPCMLDILQRHGDVLTEWQRQRAEAALAGHMSDAEDWLDFLGEVDSFWMPKEITDRTGFRGFDYKRFAAVAAWLCDRFGRVCQTVINKLLFYADFLQFKTATVSLTGAAYRKLQHGPVPADYGGLFSWMQSEGVLDLEEVVYPDGNTGTYYRAGPAAVTLGVNFTPHELSVLEYVAEAFRGYSAKRISDKSHSESAYLNTAEKELISYHEAVNLSLSLPS